MFTIFSNTGIAHFRRHPLMSPRVSQNFRHVWLKVDIEAEKPLTLTMVSRCLHSNIWPDSHDVDSQPLLQYCTLQDFLLQLQAENTLNSTAKSELKIKGTDLLHLSTPYEWIPWGFSQTNIFYWTPTPRPMFYKCNFMTAAQNIYLYTSDMFVYGKHLLKWSILTVSQTEVTMNIPIIRQ